MENGLFYTWEICICLTPNLENQRIKIITEHSEQQTPSLNKNDNLKTKHFVARLIGESSILWNQKRVRK